MRLEDLKVGDRVKYRNSWVSGESEIEQFCQNFVILKNGATVAKEYIISKLEPLPPQYKEIKIEHKKSHYYYICSDCEKSFGPFSEKLLEYVYWCDTCKENRLKNKSSIKISDLKIGDRVKFKIGEYINEGYLYLIRGDNYYISQNRDIANMENAQNWIMLKQHIISKLEPRPCKLTFRTEKYKEIPIKKESLPYLHPYICPQCHKSHGLTGIYTPQEAKYCQSCINSWNKNE